jgi:hypothetical protein
MLILSRLDKQGDFNSNERSDFVRSWITQESYRREGNQIDYHSTISP